MADAVAIISVASSATVAVLNMAFQDRRARLEGYGHRVEDLRETIDEALTPVLDATMKLQFTMTCAFGATPSATSACSEDGARLGR